MEMLVRVIEYVHSPSLEIETSGGVKFTIEEKRDGLVIKSSSPLFAEWGEPGEVVIRQLDKHLREEMESWPEPRILHGC